MSTAKGYSKAGLMRVFQIIEEFRKIYPDMQMQAGAIFITIAMNPDITSKEIRERCGIAQSTCSRNLYLLSEWLKPDKPGYGLIILKADPTERRRKIARLSPRGERIAESLVNLVGSNLGE